MKYTRTPRTVRAAVISLCKLYNDQRRSICKVFGNDEDGGTEGLWALMDRVIDTARAHIGADIASSSVRLALRTAVWQNVLCGKRGQPFERFNVPTICRDKFYGYRSAFVEEIAEGLGLWKRPKADR